MFIGSEGCLNPAQKRSNTLDHPSFKLSALPSYREMFDLAVPALCNNLADLNLDGLRQAMMGKTQHVETYIAGVSFDLFMMEDPLDLGFLVGFDCHIAVFVRIRPEHFDRSKPRQEALFQKCLNILNVLCDGPFNTDQVGDFADGFSMGVGHGESQVRYWKRIRARWMKK